MLIWAHSGIYMASLASVRPELARLCHFMPDYAPYMSDYAYICLILGDI